MSAAADTDPDLIVCLDRPLPARIYTGHGNAIFVAGGCGHRTREIGSVALRAAGRRIRAPSPPMPRPDLTSLGARGAAGFWGIVPIEPNARPLLELELLIGLEGGEKRTVALGAIEVLPGKPTAPQDAPASAGGAEIAICMATYNPSAALLRAQLDSIRAQTRDDWICVISDDRSSDESFARLEAEIAGDPRFAVNRSPQRLGIYRNFERALSMAPADAELVAFADQDDIWADDKLERLSREISDAELIYSDSRIVDEQRRVLADTYWTRRANNSTNLASLAIANTVTGAASLFRRELVELALPFPEAPGELYHDHWLALVALTAGTIHYLDEPLYDYVQHGDAALGHAAANALEPGEVAHPGFATGIRRRFERQLDWRELYFFQLVRIQVLANVLLLRCEPSDPHKRRTLERLAGLDRPSSAGWLGLRSLRRLAGRNETLGLELGLVRAIAWRHLTSRSGGRLGRRQWQRGAALPPQVVDPNVVTGEVGDDPPEHLARDERTTGTGTEPGEALADRERR
jgi:glycosyltransferase involved in cell wall biosynthesis